MCTANEIHIVLLQKSRNDVRPKGERDTTIVFAPACDILIRIRPQQVAQKATIRDLRKLAPHHVEGTKLDSKFLPIIRAKSKKPNQRV